MKTTLFFLFIVICGMALLPLDTTLAQAPVNAIVTIPDVALRAKIAKILGKPSSAQLTAADILALTHLEAPNANIQDLTGLEHAHNLRELNLGGEYIQEQGIVNSNTVTNFSPLVRLTNLRSLNLSHCSVSDVSFLAKLTQLRTLRLSNNPISDLSPLAGLTQLTFFDLSSTAISDLSLLTGLTQLRHLYLLSASISDVSPLAKLTQLTHLDLGYNSISDISPLANLIQLTGLHLWGNSISDLSALSGLTQLKTLGLSNNSILDVSPLVGLNLQGTKWNSTGLYIEHNPLSYASINRHIPAMQAKGVEIKFTNRVPTTLMKILGIAQQGVVNSELPLPFVVKVLDEEDRAFAGVPVKFAITAGGGKLSATTVRTNATGKAAAHLRMGRTVGTTTVRVTAADVAQPIRFTATAILRSAPVAVPDDNLRVKIAETLGKPLGGTLTAADMLKLKTLTAQYYFGHPP